MTLFTQCPDCTEKIKTDTLSIFRDRPRTDLLNLNVKLAFSFDGVTEHMWVMVKRIDEETIYGKLLNQPRFLDDLWEKDEIVAFSFEDIEEIG